MSKYFIAPKAKSIVIVTFSSLAFSVVDVNHSDIELLRDLKIFQSKKNVESLMNDCIQ